VCYDSCRAVPVPQPELLRGAVPEKQGGSSLLGFNPKFGVTTFCAMILFSSIASAQTATTPAKKTATQKSVPSTAAPKAASKTAITLERVCPPGTPGGKAFDAGCKTVVSEQEMDKLITALNPEMTPAVKQNLGRSMAEWIAYSAKARELGLDKTPEFAEVMHFARTQLLAQALAKKVQTKAETVTPAELQAYYDSHKSELEEFNFLRVIVPRATPSKDKPTDEAAETQFAQQIRDRLAKGEDAKTLQTEAFKHAALGAQEPPVEINGRKRGSVPPSQESIFNLKDGEVSAVLPDPSAFFIYKLVSRSVAPLDKATPDVKKALVKDRLEKAVNELNAQFDVKLSESYFGPQQATAPMGAPSMRGTPRNAPPAQAPPTQAPPYNTQVPK
jgi:hypothetical protein